MCAYIAIRCRADSSNTAVRGIPPAHVCKWLLLCVGKPERQSMSGVSTAAVGMFCSSRLHLVYLFFYFLSYNTFELDTHRSLGLQHSKASHEGNAWNKGREEEQLAACGFGGGAARRAISGGGVIAPRAPVEVATTFPASLLHHEEKDRLPGRLVCLRRRFDLKVSNYPCGGSMAYAI